MKPFDPLLRLCAYFIDRPRRLVILVLVGVVWAFAYGGYLFWALQETRTQLAETEARLERTETAAGSSEVRIQEVLSRLEFTQRSMLGAIHSLNARYTEIEQDLQAEFETKLAEVRAENEARLSELSLEDVVTRRRVAQETHARFQFIRDELSAKMIQSYQAFKADEDELVRALAERIESGELIGDAFKRIFDSARQAVVFVRTDYRVRFPLRGEVRDFTTRGTGYLLTAQGLGITAQHVVAPWHYDRQLAVLRKLGVAEVVPDSVVVSLWETDRQVVDESVRPPRTLRENAYVSGRAERGLRILYTPEIDMAEQVVQSPGGPVKIETPRVGGTDVAVFQITGFDRSFATIPMAPTPLDTVTLDEVLVIGYPLSSLQKGFAMPQASRGRVRRISEDVLELDSPLHPGISGGPILNRRGELIGMAGAIIGSPVYGIAVRAEDLVSALRGAREAVRRDQERFAGLGCDPGPPDGVLGRRTWLAYQCAGEMIEAER